VVLALGDEVQGLPGREAVEPVFGLPGKWIPVALRGQAELLGATVVDRSSLIITHLSETVRRCASRLLGREEVAAATRALKQTHPVVVEDLTPALLTLGEIQRVLHALLDEGVPIRDLVRIYESLSLAAKGGADPDRLVEAARAALAPAIVSAHAEDGRLPVLTVEPRVQQTLLESLRPGESGASIAADAGLLEAVLQSVHRTLAEQTARGQKPVLVVPAPLRAPVRRLLRLSAPNLPVLSYPELASSSVNVEAIGVIDDARSAVS
jgi:flagellar biosynthesis protein FlhA